MPATSSTKAEQEDAIDPKKQKKNPYYTYKEPSVGKQIRVGEKKRPSFRGTMLSPHKIP